MGRIEILMQALESGNFPTVLYKIISEDESAQLEQVAVDLSEHLTTLEDLVLRNQCQMGIQSIRAALCLRSSFPNGKKHQS